NPPDAGGIRALLPRAGRFTQAPGPGTTAVGSPLYPAGHGIRRAAFAWNAEDRTGPGTRDRHGTGMVPARARVAVQPRYQPTFGPPGPQAQGEQEPTCCFRTVAVATGDRLMHLVRNRRSPRRLVRGMRSSPEAAIGPYQPGDGVLGAQRNRSCPQAAGR